MAGLYVGLVVLAALSVQSSATLVGVRPAKEASPVFGSKFDDAPAMAQPVAEIPMETDPVPRNGWKFVPSVVRTPTLIGLPSAGLTVPP